MKTILVSMINAFLLNIDSLCTSGINNVSPQQYSTVGMDSMQVSYTKKTSELGKTMYCCTLCPKEVSSYRSIKYHYMSHTGVYYCYTYLF